MTLSAQWLDELRSRTSLTGLVGATVKLTGRGAEKKGCCPFHNEKTPSFTINEDKGFYHCFGCGAHGDAIRWLTDARGMAFIDAVKELAGAAGMEVPARSADAAKRDETVAQASVVLDQAASWFAARLAADAKAVSALADRGISDATVQRFGIGFAPARVSVSGCGLPTADLVAAGLMVDDGSGLFRDRFRQRLMIPIHDARGRIVGFAGRIVGPGEPKYLNSPDSDHFNKGDLLFNLHRAGPAARAARRLIIVEGQFDTIAMDQAGIAETVAPQGTALTERQLHRAWRVAHCPVLLFDGDNAGRTAALRACERAIPHVGAGQTLAIALLPDGEDPDSLIRSSGRDAVEAIIASAQPLAAFLWDQVLALSDQASPEGRAGIWGRLAALAQDIRDSETRAQYVAEWRRRFDDAFPTAPALAAGGQSKAFQNGRAGGLLPTQGPAARQVTASEAVQLRRIGEAWLKSALGRVDRDGDSVKALAWNAGRRDAAGMVDIFEAAARIMRMVNEAGLELTLGNVGEAIEQGRLRGFDVGPVLVDLDLADYPLTDFGLAERFRDRFGSGFKFTTAKGWLGWDGRRWKVLDQDQDTAPAELVAAVFETVRAVQREARHVRATGIKWALLTREGPKGGLTYYVDEEGTPEFEAAVDRWVPKGAGFVRFSEQLAGWGRQSEVAGKPVAIANLARRWLTVPIEDFDCEQMAVNVLNGTLRFRVEALPGGQRKVVVQLDDHDRDDLITKLAPVEYDRDAPAPLYDGMIAWAQPDPTMRRYVHQVGGYACTGDTGQHLLWFNYGRGRNGKSVTIDSWASAVGDYSGTIGIESFLDQGIKKRGDAATPDLAKLGGVRLLRASEPERGAKLNSALIKGATGGEPMSVRALHRGFYDLMPRFKLLMSGNSKPAIPDTDEGIWGRMKLVPWLRHIEKPNEDPYASEFPCEAWPARDAHLGDKIKAQELPGVFARLVDGLIDFLEHGFVEPQRVTLATADYRNQSDPLARFLALCTVTEGGSRVKSSELHEVFAGWCKAAGEKEWSQKGFSDAMIDKGFTKTRSDGMRWEGLRLTRSVSDFVDENGRARLLSDDLTREPDADPAAGAAASRPSFHGDDNDDDLPINL